MPHLLTTVLTSPLFEPDGRAPQAAWEITWLPLSTSDHSWGSHTVTLWADEPPVQLVNKATYYSVEPQVVSLAGVVEVIKGGNEVGSVDHVKRGGDYHVREMTDREYAAHREMSAAGDDDWTWRDDDRQRAIQAAMRDEARLPSLMCAAWDAMIADDPDCLDGVILVDKGWLVRDGLDARVERCAAADLNRPHVTVRMMGNAEFGPTIGQQPTPWLEYRVWSGEEDLDHCPPRRTSQIVSLDEEYLRSCLRDLAGMVAGRP